MSYYLILPALPEFLAKYPEIDVECGVSDRPADLIGDNVDCVIRGGPLLEPSLVARHIGDMRWLTCATPSYFERYRDRLTRPTSNPAMCSRVISSRAADACVRCTLSATASASRSRRALASPSTTAARTLPPCAPVPASASCSHSWCRPAMRRVNSCPCFRTGNPRHCRFMCCIQRIVIFRPRCACSWTGQQSSFREPLHALVNIGRVKTLGFLLAALAAASHRTRWHRFCSTRAAAVDWVDSRPQ